MPRAISSSTDPLSLRPESAAACRQSRGSATSYDEADARGFEPRPLPPTKEPGSRALYVEPSAYSSSWLIGFGKIWQGSSRASRLRQVYARLFNREARDEAVRQALTLLGR